MRNNIKFSNSKDDFYRFSQYVSLHTGYSSPAQRRIPAYKNNKCISQLLVYFLDIYLAVKCEKNNFALQIGYFLHFLSFFFFLDYLTTAYTQIFFIYNIYTIYNIHSELNKLVHINIIPCDIGYINSIRHFFYKPK